MSEQTDAKNTKNEILRSATRLLRLRSFNSFSYNDIAQEVGIKKASIHYHFPTKDVLGLEAVDSYRGWMKHLITKLERSTSDPWIELEQFFEFFESGLKEDMLCPGGVLSVEFNTLQPEMQEGLRQLFTYYIDWLTDLLESGRKAGEFSFKGTAYDRAVLISSAVEGALIFARAYDISQFEIVVNQLADALK